MEMPGESAVYTGLSAEFPQQQVTTPFSFRAVLQSYDERYDLLQSSFTLGFASGEIRALARPARVPHDIAGIGDTFNGHSSRQDSALTHRHEPRIGREPRAAPRRRGLQGDRRVRAK